MTSLEHLGSVLAPTVAALPDDVRTPHEISAHSHEIAQLTSSHGPVDLIAKALEGEKSLAGYDGKLHWFGGGSVRMTYQSIAVWLLARSRITGTSKALGELATFVDATELRAFASIALDGVDFDSPVQLAEDVSIVPWAMFPETATKSYLTRGIFATGVRRPHAAIVHSVRIPKLLYHQDDKPEVPAVSFDTANDALLVLALAGPVAPYALATWVDVPESVPSLGAAMMLSEATGTFHRTSLPPDAQQQLAPVWAAWRSLPSASQASLRVPLYRLVSAMRRRTTVDAAIDLGIAIESAFLSDVTGASGELKFRIQLRAARWLSEGATERAAVFALVGALYDARSTAVHQGVLGPKVGKHDTGALLRDGYSVMARALSKLILVGIPDWKLFVLQ